MIPASYPERPLFGGMFGLLRTRSVEGVIEVANLAKRFGATAAVDDLSFTAQAGTVTGFLGPNLSGKSTMMRVILGLAAPSSGTTRVCGVPYRQLSRPCARWAPYSTRMGCIEAEPGRPPSALAELVESAVLCALVVVAGGAVRGLIETRGHSPSRPHTPSASGNAM